jgi:hypothetical protein
MQFTGLLRVGTSSGVSRLKVRTFIGLLFVFLSIFSGCSGSGPAENIPNPILSRRPGPNSGTALTINSCLSVTGTAWVPQLPENTQLSPSESVKLEKVTLSVEGRMTGLSDGYRLEGPSVYTAEFSLPEDLGDFGSLTLTAEVSSAVAGNDRTSAYPVLVSLHDGVNELVNLSGCTSGFFNCKESTCTPIESCGPVAPSAFLGSRASERKAQWVQSNFGTENVSVNTFPTCNWSEGDFACPFNQKFFEAGKLRPGRYLAKYVLVSSGYTGLSDLVPATLKLTVLKKYDSALPGKIRKMDLNVILVGDRNVQDSRTPKGKQNLDALFDHVYRTYFEENHETVGVAIGQLKVFEWCGESGGDAFAVTGSDRLGELYQQGTLLMPPETEGKAVNIFLITSISGTGSATLLGHSGGIGGAPIHGTKMSGTVFSTFNKLARFNPQCTGLGECDRAKQDASFIDMGSTLAHEIGHFLGLNHLSESNGTVHDPLPDTPICTQRSFGVDQITINSCHEDAQVYLGTGLTCAQACPGYNAQSVFCPEQVECQFNHLMWWTGKNFGVDGKGDGNYLSKNSGFRIYYSPIIH